MKNKKNTVIKVSALLLLIAAAAVAGYFLVFHNADQLTVRDGKVTGAKSTWLIARFAAGGGEEKYYKIADVNAPKGYGAAKDAKDPDGDAVTTFFAFQGKDADKNPGTLTVEAVSAAYGAEWTGRETEIGGVRGTLYTPDAEEGKALVFLMDSPYANEKIAVRADLPASVEEEEGLSILAAMAEKIVPGKQLSPIAAEFKLNFLDDARWKYLWNGLGVTLEITLFAVLMGIVIGVLVAGVRSTWDQNQENLRKGPGRAVLGFFNGICKVYLTVIRGTPVVIQLMIMYYIIFASSRNGVLIAILAFGINSGAYVAEIIRGGIMSIDAGQLEAGRSLGFNYVRTMQYVIVPQAMKNVLPALANEFIVLLKETSVAGYVAVKDLTKGGDIIRGVTYSAFMPLLAVAAIYLIMVMFFTWLVGKLERRLRSSDH